MDADQIRPAARGPRTRIAGSTSTSTGNVRGSPLVGGHEPVQVTLRAPSVSRSAAEHQLSRPRRSSATERRARCSSTRTAPSERPRTAAISAVDISSTKRRMTARRRSSGRRATACQAALPASRAAAASATSSGAGSSAASSSGRHGAAAVAASLVRDDVAGNAEEPDAERGELGRVGLGARASATRERDELVDALLEAGQAGQRLHEDTLGRVFGGVMVAELVEGVAVHLGQVLPIQGVETGRIAPGRFDQAAVAVQPGGTGALLRIYQTPAGSIRYTPAAGRPPRRERRP